MPSLPKQLFFRAIPQVWGFFLSSASFCFIFLKDLKRKNSWSHGPKAGAGPGYVRAAEEVFLLPGGSGGERHGWYHPGEDAGQAAGCWQRWHRGVHVSGGFQPTCGGSASAASAELGSALRVPSSPRGSSPASRTRRGWSITGHVEKKIKRRGKKNPTPWENGEWLLDATAVVLAP